MGGYIGGCIVVRIYIGKNIVGSILYASTSHFTIVASGCNLVGGYIGGYLGGYIGGCIDV